ncbi:TRAP-type C4-dicarboxylate transport system permease small subunit [Rhodovulum imhoffii]|uniref:TRAP transporter small permease protein n=1 Tax=Rhodovulum imhoffii TaxID=365340 RepID=A0A2T5BTU3_9RHOB|nr:TRAP transporter small permease [Rhodovulum imhoffii]MBK5933947.1 C4-dicarboxylate ABC transporter permease [Rhodovulum imhoffii]PTN02893.1 TRAP-type C4-dicarboxylate transport system permease small subunit [Rhodovulum imhoffii]
MRRSLDHVYRAAGGLAAIFILAIVILVFAQVCLNLADKISIRVVGKGIGLTIPSYSDFTGFFLAASSFLALAYTLRQGGHIRVTLLTGRLPVGLRRIFDVSIVLLALVMSAYATWYMIELVRESVEFGDRSSGMVSVPLWLPQLPVALGLAVLTLALADDLVGLLRGRAASWEGKDESLLSE